MNSISNRVVVITGGGRGIGKNIALAFAKQGARVHVCDRDEQRLRSTVGEFLELGHDLRPLCLDLSLSGEPQRMIREVAESAGRVDFLINNAQSTVRAALLDETEESWDAGLAVTLKAAFFASQEAVRVMSKHGSGAIVNIASVAGFLATHESPSYHIAKAGLLQMTRYFASEAGKHGVRVNCICPAFIVQDEHRARYEGDDNRSYRELAEYCQPMGKVGGSDDVAEAALFLCSSRSAFINGQSIVLDGGATLQDQFCLMQEYSMRRQGK